MSIQAKIQLSELELELINNTDWILTKQSILKKVYLLFGEMLEAYKDISTSEQIFIPGFDPVKNGKISKGENYLGFPYTILDYPALFKRKNIFAVRTMFWWGNFFSITLHISGEDMLKNISLSYLLNDLRDSGFFVCIAENEWQHSFDTSNYIPVNDIDEKMHAAICSKHFFKISKKIELNKWNEVPGFLEKTYREILDVIKLSYYSRLHTYKVPGE